MRQAAQHHRVREREADPVNAEQRRGEPAHARTRRGEGEAEQHRQHEHQREHELRLAAVQRRAQQPG